MDRSRRGDGLASIGLERTHVTGLKHVNGAISMARGGPDTATSSFFICVGDQPELDYEGRRNPDGQGFAAFGLVLEGMDIVRSINRSPADGQTLASLGPHPEHQANRVLTSGHRLLTVAPSSFRQRLSLAGGPTRTKLKRVGSAQPPPIDQSVAGR